MLTVSPGADPMCVFRTSSPLRLIALLPYCLIAILPNGRSSRPPREDPRRQADGVQDQDGPVFTDLGGSADAPEVLQAG